MEDAVNGLALGTVTVATLAVALLVGRSVGPDTGTLEATLEVQEARQECMAMRAALQEVHLELSRGGAKMDTIRAALGLLEVHRTDSYHLAETAP